MTTDHIYIYIEKQRINLCMYILKLLNLHLCFFNAFFRLFETRFLISSSVEIRYTSKIEFEP